MDLVAAPVLLGMPGQGRGRVGIAEAVKATGISFESMPTEQPPEVAARVAHCVLTKESVIYSGSHPPPPAYTSSPLDVPSPEP